MLAQQAAELCLDLERRLDPGLSAEVATVRASCRGPLVVAVAGRVNAGKSTLINALIGRRAAPTDARECTRLVTIFRYGEINGVDVIAGDGRSWSVPLDDRGQVPAAFPVPATDVSRVEVTLRNPLLQDLTVVDTPGLASAHGVNSQRTQEFLGLEQVDPASVAAAGQAAATLFVFTQAFRADDRETVRAFRALSARLGGSPLNSLGVLNKADLLADDPTLEQARRLAADQAVALRRDLAAVLPVVGLLGETVEAGRFTEAHAAALNQIAALSGGQLLSLLASADRFCRIDVPVLEADRAQLLERLDLFGVQTALRCIGEGRRGAAALRDVLLAASGFPAVRDLVDRAFRERADALQAGAALSRLSQLAAATSDRAAAQLIGGEVERLQLDPAAHVLAEIDTAAAVASGMVVLPAEMEEEVLRLYNGTSASARLGLPETVTGVALAEASVRAANRWRGFAAVEASPGQARVAMTVHRSYVLLHRQLSGAPASRR